MSVAVDSLFMAFNPVKYSKYCKVLILKKSVDIVMS
jgi:hypothetical protein